MRRCRFWGVPECAFCRQGQKYGEGPCHDKRTRRLLDERDIWWPGSKLTWEPDDYRDWKRRQRLYAKWSAVYRGKIERVTEEARKYNVRVRDGGRCEICGTYVYARSTRCKNCKGSAVKWLRYAQRRA